MERTWLNKPIDFMALNTSLCRPWDKSGTTSRFPSLGVQLGARTVWITENTLKKKDTRAPAPTDDDILGPTPVIVYAYDDAYLDSSICEVRVSLSHPGLLKVYSRPFTSGLDEIKQSLFSNDPVDWWGAGGHDVARSG